MSQFAQGPLSNIVVVDLSRALAGPHAAMMLGDMGARVIKVENPDGGDDTRGWGPPFVGEPAESTYFLSCNRNKESITLDLKEAEGKTTLRRLIQKADVLVENFRPGVLARLGFGTAELEEINPRLVTLSISGFGHDGPEGTRAGYDQIAQGEAGLMSLTGPDSDHPTRVGVPIGDLLAGMYGAYGVVAALNERNATGKEARFTHHSWHQLWEFMHFRGLDTPSPAKFRKLPATITHLSFLMGSLRAPTVQFRWRSDLRIYGAVLLMLLD